MESMNGMITSHILVVLSDFVIITTRKFQNIFSAPDALENRPWGKIRSGTFSKCNSNTAQR
jgi:hypothetical protein